MRKCAKSWESQKSRKKRNGVFFAVRFVFEANILCSQSSGFAKGLPQLYQTDSEVSRHRRENLLQRQTISRPPPTEEERRWAREGRGSSYLQVVAVHWKFHCLEIVKNSFFSNALRWGRLLKHSAGLCLRPSEEDDDGTLMLLSCSFPPVGVESRGCVIYIQQQSAVVPSCDLEVEQNIRVVESENQAYHLKQGGRRLLVDSLIDIRWQCLIFGVFALCLLNHPFQTLRLLRFFKHKTHATGALMSKETMILRWHPRSPNWHSRLIVQLSLNQKVLCFLWVCGSNTHPGYLQWREQHVGIKFIHGTFQNHARNLVHRSSPKALDCLWSHYKEPAACNDS